MRRNTPIAVGLIATGIVFGGATMAHATEGPTPSTEYVTVLWSFPGYPSLDAPQPFVNSYAGADLHAFDATLASVDSCGHAFQVDVYKVADEHGTSWESLKATGALNTSTDGGFLAYDAVPTPYRVITPEEYPCAPTTPPTDEPTTPPVTTPPTEEPTAPPTTTPPTQEPTAPPTTTPPVVTPPTDEPTVPPVTETPKPSPTAPTSAPTSQPSVPSTTGKRASVTPAPVAAETSTPTGELAYTGANPWPGIGAASALLVAGATTLIAAKRRARRG